MGRKNLVSFLVLLVGDVDYVVCVSQARMLRLLLRLLLLLLLLLLPLLLLLLLLVLLQVQPVCQSTSICVYCLSYISSP